MPHRILVVDDDPAINEMLTIVLESEGFETQSVTDGAAAVPAFNDYDPDIVLLDLMLPGMNGVDICREIQGLRGADRDAHGENRHRRCGAGPGIGC